MKIEKYIFEFILKLYILKYVKKLGINRNLEFEIIKCEQNLQINCDICQKNVQTNKFTKHIVQCLSTSFVNKDFT